MIVMAFAFSEREESAVVTIVVRGSTQNVLDDIERSIDDAVNTFKALTRDGRLLPGAAATEIELAHQLQKYSQVNSCSLFILSVYLLFIICYLLLIIATCLLFY